MGGANSGRKSVKFEIISSLMGVQSRLQNVKLNGLYGNKIASEIEDIVEDASKITYEEIGIIANIKIKDLEDKARIQFFGIECCINVMRILARVKYLGLRMKEHNFEEISEWLEEAIRLCKVTQEKIEREK